MEEKREIQNRNTIRYKAFELFFVSYRDWYVSCPFIFNVKSCIASRQVSTGDVF